MFASNCAYDITIQKKRFYGLFDRSEKKHPIVNAVTREIGIRPRLNEIILNPMQRDLLRHR